MSGNPFHDAIKDGPVVRAQTIDRSDYRSHWNLNPREAANRAGMTRQEQFNNGILTVADMDDEELRAGRMRDAKGRIPRVTKTLEMVPRDLYDEMVQEHNKRTNEKIRNQLDTALQTMVDIMADESCEPKDRLDAAKYLFERQMGKQPDKVLIAPDRAPWEELLGDVAQVTRAQHERAKRGEVWDAEVVEDDPVNSQSQEAAPPRASEPSMGAEADRDGDGYQHVAEVQRVPDVAGAEARDDAPTRPEGHQLLADDGPRYPDPVVPTPFDPAEPAPSHDIPAHSNPVVEVQLSEKLREAQEAQVRIAEARAARKKAVDAAKKRRRAQRAVGADVLRRKLKESVGAEFAETQDRLSGNTLDETGEEGV